jgi:hypothetical protein
VVRGGVGLRVRLPEGATEWATEELRQTVARPLERLWNEEAAS